MLIIRPQQMAVLQTAADGAFVRRVAEHLRRRHAGVVVRLASGASALEALPDETLREMVGRGVTRARAYGMKAEAALAGFVCLMFRVAPNFDSHPLIRRVLEDPEVEPDARLGRLWERVSDDNWDAAKQQYDADAWRPK